MIDCSYIELGGDRLSLSKQCKAKEKRLDKRSTVVVSHSILTVAQQPSRMERWALA